MYQNNLCITVALLGFVCLMGCAPSSVDGPPITLTTETLRLPDSTTVRYERGIIAVPQNRKTGADTTWPVEFVRLFRDRESMAGTPPIFILRGGPGTEAASQLLEDPSYYTYFYAPLTQIADVIIPGQRGFQTSGNTACSALPEMPLSDHLNPDRRKKALQDGLAACRRQMEAAGINLQGLNVEEMAADVRDIAVGLGYSSIQLIGQSFGSHLGLATIRLYPDLVARATLSALEGPDHTYDMPAGVAAALKNIAATAEATPELAPHIPEDGLIAAYQALIDRAELTPIPVTYQDEDTGEEITVSLDGDAFRTLARGYSRGTNWRYLVPFWPLDILNMLNGELEGAARRYVWVKSFSRLQDAAYYQIDCSSGISDARKQQLASDEGVSLVGNLHANYETVCQPWDADLGAAFRASFTTDVPAVLVHGDWDTSTPFENAATVRSFFNNHRFVHVVGGSHGAFREAKEDVEGFEALVHNWMATGDYTAVPEKVTLPPLDWRAP